METPNNDNIAQKRTRSELRILYVMNSSDLYGANRALVRMLKGRDRDWLKPVVLIPTDGPIRGYLEACGVEVVIEPSLCVIDRANFRPLALLALGARFPKSIFRLGKIIRKYRIQIVHTNTGVILSPPFAAALLNVPHVWHIRESFQEFRRIWPLYSRFMLATSRWIIAISQEVARQFPANRKVVLIHDALDLDEYEVDSAALRSEFRDRFALGDLPTVGCVGRIKYVRKGQEFLVQAAAALKARGVRAKYVIAGAPAPGSEGDLDRLRSLITSLGLEEDVILVGEFADVRPVYASLDVFTLTSAQPEPLGLVILEAMAMGLPVVATDFGGPRETVEEGRTGFRVPPADPNALAEKLQLLIEDAPLRHALGQAGRESVARRFSLPIMWRSLKAVYGETLRVQPKPAAAVTNARTRTSLDHAAISQGD